jgi:hypothetical protein
MTFAQSNCDIAGVNRNSACDRKTLAAAWR